MSKYKNLHINRSLLDSMVEEFCKLKGNNYNIKKELINQSSNQNRYTISTEGLNFSIDLYFRSDGKTTMRELGSGDSIANSLELCEYIYSKLEYKDSPIGEFSVIVDVENAEHLFRYIEGIKGVKIVKNDNVNNGIGLRKVFQSEIGDKVTLTYYKRTGTLLYQGHIMKLYSEVKCYLAPLVKINCKISNVKELNEDDIELEIEKLIPKAYNNIKRELIDLIHDSIIQIKYKVPYKDYSVWTFPTLKALEKYIYCILKSNNIRVYGNTFSIKNNKKIEKNNKKTLPIFVKDDRGKYKVDTNLIKISDQKVLDNLAICYNYYKKNRHSLFHTNAIPGTDRKIKSPDEARIIVYEVCGIIENSYKDIGI